MRDRQPSRAANVGLASALEDGPGDGDDAGGERDRDQGAPPAAEKRGERHRDRRRDRRADLDARRVHARPRRRLLGDRLADGERREPVPEPHPDADAPGEEDDEHCGRGERPKQAEHPDQDKADRHRPARAKPRREVGGHRREQPHAQHRDRPEKADQGMRRAGVLLDLIDQRPDADDLRAQGEGGEEQPGKRGVPRPVRQRPEAFARRRAMRPNSSTCFRASRPAAPGLSERIASRIGTCFSAASRGSTYVP